MKAFIAAAVGAMSASWIQTRNEADVYAWGSAPAFSSSEFQSYKLTEVESITHDTKKFRFALASPKTVLDLPVASCISLRYTAANGEEVIRPYTPTNLTSDQGHFDLVVKCYPNSKMGSHLFGMKVGDSIDAKGPWPTLEVKPNQYTEIGMIAGGTGLTPMYQVLNNVLTNENSKTKVALLFANKSIDDILLEKELDAHVAACPGRFAVYHCLSKPPSKWNGYSGHVTKTMIKETMPAPEHKDDSMILVSGPPGFMKAVSGPKDYSGSRPQQGPLAGLLKEMGYTSSCVYKF